MRSFYTVSLVLISFNGSPWCDICDVYWLQLYSRVIVCYIIGSCEIVWGNLICLQGCFCAVNLPTEVVIAHWSERLIIKVWMYCGSVSWWHVCWSEHLSDTVVIYLFFKCYLLFTFCTEPNLTHVQPQFLCFANLLINISITQPVDPCHGSENVVYYWSNPNGPGF